MKNQKIIFILIGIFCFFALVTGIYTEFFTEKTKVDNTQNPNISIKDDNKTKTEQEVKDQFKNLFTNELVVSENSDFANLEKNDSSKEIVYTAHEFNRQTEKYEIDLHLPYINIKGNVINELNNNTKSIFYNEESKIINNGYEEKILYNVNYIASINGNILSVAIESTFKQGANPQRIIIQTYNYNIETGEKVEFLDMLTRQNILQSDCQDKINQVVTKAQEEAQVLVKSGYTVYNRDLSNDIYKVANISNFYLGQDGELYVIFAYGNSNFTSEMDVILFEQ